MHFLVLGATGAIGTQFCEIALAEGHSLTLLVRTPSKLPETIHHNDQVKIIQGNLDDDVTPTTAAECGADTFVTFAGPPFGNQGTPLTTAYESLIPRLTADKINRLLILCTPSFQTPSDNVPFKFRFGGWFMRLFSPGQYWEMVGVGNVVASLPDDGNIKWTLFRVGGLTNGVEAPVQAAYLSGKEGMWISRASVARWVLDEAIEGKWVGGVPYISNT